MQILAIKAPSLTEDEYKDVATFVKADFWDRRGGKYLKDLKMQNIGFAQKVTVNGEYVVIIGGSGDVSARTQELKDQMEQEKDLMFKTKLEKRIASLNSGVVIIRVGTMTEIERGYRKLKIEDAVNSARAALEEGVVRGGGLAAGQTADGGKERGVFTRESEELAHIVRKIKRGALSGDTGHGSLLRVLE